MHIMEGFLPLPWAVFWTILVIPFWIYGIRAMRKFFIEHPEKKLSLALSGAFIVILSSLKIPSVTGSSSHPTGTGLSVMLSGPWNTVIICTIVLLFQGTFMAHGGFTTLGANVFSMGIAGPFAAFAVFKYLRKIDFNSTLTVFIVVFVADIVTYVVTALQLALIVPYTGMSAFIDTYATFFGIFALTQVPIAFAEGVMIVFFFKYLADVRPDLVKGIGFNTSVRNTRSLLSEDTKDSILRVSNKVKTRLMIAGFIIVTTAMVLLAYATTFFADIGGADDAGADTITDLIPGYNLLAENYIQLSELHISLLFIVQTVIGVLILAYVLHRLLKRKRDRIAEVQEET